MEYFPHGDLQGCISNKLTEDDAKLITGQLLEGLSVMHKNNFTHRDLKPQVGSPLKASLIQAFKIKAHMAGCLLEYLRCVQITRLVGQDW